MSQLQSKPVVAFIERLQHTGGLKSIDIANFAGVSKATVSRWASGQKSPHPKTQLIMSDLAYVVMRLSEYYSNEEIRAWLYARHPQLEGARAIDLIHDDRSEEVVAILDRLDADAYLQLCRIESTKSHGDRSATSLCSTRWRSSAWSVRPVAAR